jgi:hypothetical protein
MYLPGYARQHGIHATTSSDDQLAASDLPLDEVIRLHLETEKPFRRYVSPAPTHGPSW